MPVGKNDPHKLPVSGYFGLSLGGKGTEMVGKLVNGVPAEGMAAPMLTLVPWRSWLSLKVTLSQFLSATKTTSSTVRPLS